MLYVYDNYSQILDGIQAVGVIAGAALAVVNPPAGVGVIAATMGAGKVQYVQFCTGNFSIASCYCLYSLCKPASKVRKISKAALGLKRKFFVSAFSQKCSHKFISLFAK
jgi:hypothetical protein